MTLINGIDWLQRARREKFALGAFNANTLEQVQAIAAAAEEDSVPLVIQVSHRALQYIGSGNSQVGLQYIAAVGKVAIENSQALIVFHLDHATEDEILAAANLGFSSVMFDRADLPLQTYIQKTIELRRRLHDLGISIEAEVGEVPRLGANGFYSEEERTDPELAAEFVEQTGVDALAVAIGSVHAVKQKELELDFDRLEKIAAVVQIPLVLHGSSGVTDASLARGIELGLSKINVATQLNQAFTRAVRTQLAENVKEVDPRRYLQPAREAVKAKVRERIRLFGTPRATTHAKG